MDKTRGWLERRGSASPLLMLTDPPGGARLAAEVALFDDHTLQNAPLSPVASLLTGGAVGTTAKGRLSVSFAC